MKRSAFTLVEMLLVVAIIALLISMLLPMLGRAKDHTQSTVCQSNLRQQGAGLAAYSASNGRRLPPYNAGGQYEAVDYIVYPWLTYRCGIGPGSQPPTSVTPRNHGTLFAEGYVDNPSLFYCPRQPGWYWQLSTYPKPWLSEGIPGFWNGEPVAGSAWQVRSSYNFNPYEKNDGTHRRLYPRADMIPNTGALMIDLIFGEYWFNSVAHDEDTAWNVLHPDLAVITHSDDEAYRLSNLYQDLYWPEYNQILKLILED